MRLKLKYMKRKFLEERCLVLDAAKGKLAREAKLLKLQTQEPRAKSVAEGRKPIAIKEGLVDSHSP